MGIQYYDVKIYRYGDRYKINYIKRFASPELYVPDDDIRTDEEDLAVGKLVNNICRAKSNVLALGMCNPWEYFVTFTLDPRKYSRDNLSLWQKDFSHYIRNQRQIHSLDIKYLLIPELHKDGRSWHMHGFIMGIPWDNLLDFLPGQHPIRLIRGGYRWHKGINDRFGFNSFGKIQNVDAASKYALKYITKSMAARKEELGTHLYYCSRGLHRPEMIAEGCTIQFLSEVEFENQFMASGWLDEAQIANVKGVLL